MVTSLLQVSHGKLLLTQVLQTQMVLSMSTNILFNTRDSKTSLLSEMLLLVTSLELTLLLQLKVQSLRTTFLNSWQEKSLMESMMVTHTSQCIWATLMLLDSPTLGITNQLQTTMLSHNMDFLQSNISTINWSQISMLQSATPHSRRIMAHHTSISLKHSTHWNTTKSFNQEMLMLRLWEAFMARKRNWKALMTRNQLHEDH